MSTYYTHSANDVIDLITGKVKQIPFVAVDGRTRPKNMEDLVLIISTVVFGIYQTDPDSVPYFTVGSHDTVTVETIDPKWRDREANIFPETYGDIKLNSEVKTETSTTFSNETMDLDGLINYLFVSYKRIIEDSTGLSIDSFTINDKTNRIHYSEGESVMIGSYINVAREEFNKFISDMNYRSQDNSVSLFVRKVQNAYFEK